MVILLPILLILYCIISQVYGHDKISILDGGLPKWIEKGYPTVSGPQQQLPTLSYKATYHPELYRTLDQMKENHTTRKEQVRISGNCYHSA